MQEARVTLADYLSRRERRHQEMRRPTCARCWKSLSTCFCHLLTPFTAPIEFVFLQHRAEATNTIATARMAHLSLRNSKLLIGHEFESDQRVDSLLDVQGRRHMLLYPRADAEPLDKVLNDAVAPSADRLVLWVLDAKWGQVPKMLRLSPTVGRLPATAFVPDRPSDFRVRTQPKPGCLSTIEAVHTVLERFAKLTGSGDTRHDGMIEVFRHLVKQQLGFCNWREDSRHFVAKRKRLERRLAREAGL